MSKVEEDNVDGLGGAWRPWPLLKWALFCKDVFITTACPIGEGQAFSLGQVERD